MEAEIEKKAIGTPYDDAFRTMLVDCIRLVIPVINEVFGKHYTGNEEIIAHPNEHFMMQPGDVEKRISDGNFTIRAEQDETYLFECQSTPDSNMLIRIWEYIVQIAVERGTVEKNRMVVRIPNAAILYLRSNSTTPDEMEIVIEAATGSLSLPVRVMKIKDYTLDAIFEKRLYFLVPFFIFTHEGDFIQHSEDLQWLDKLKAEYIELMEQLNDAVSKEQLSLHYYWTIVEMTKKVIENIAFKYGQIREGVISVMGGKVLEYESKTVYREGVKDGEARGRQEEREQMSIKLYNLGVPIEQIAESAGVSVDIIKQWVAKHTA